MMTRKDFLLVFIAAATTDVPMGPRHIQNAMFLLGKSGVPELPEPYYCFENIYVTTGRRCPDIYHDIQTLCGEGKLFVVPAGYDESTQKGIYSRWAVSVDGWYSALSIMEDRGFSKSTAEYINRMGEWIKSHPSIQIDDAVNQAFPHIYEV